METFKRYLFFQAMMFVFGIVGPIFLIIYFASQPDTTVRWAYWWGLFITTGDILIALALAGANRDETNKKTPKDVKIALALEKRMQSGRADTGSSSSSSSSSDPFIGGAALFASSDSGSSSDSGWFSSDFGSSSSGDSGSSSSDSGSSSSSSD